MTVPSSSRSRGPNGAGKTTFYHAHLTRFALLLVNADQLARELEIDPYAASRIADRVRRTLVDQRESFAFETVFSDPVGDKVQFLQKCVSLGAQSWCASSGFQRQNCLLNELLCESHKEATTSRRIN